MSAGSSPSGKDGPLDKDPGPGGVHQHACVLCQQRKVKCDRLHPSCTGCQKAKTDCVYRVPPPPRRRKRKPSEPLLHSRLKKCEQLLEKHGISLGDINSEPAPATFSGSDKPTPLNAERSNSSMGALESPYSGYVDSTSNVGNARPVYRKSELWDDLKQVQLPNSANGLEDDYDDDTGSSTVDVDYKTPGYDGDWLWGASSPPEFEFRYPLPQECKLLWRIHRENVDPVMKIIHGPTIDGLMGRLAKSPQEITRSERTLIFSIFASAVNSMSEDDCRSGLGEEKSILLQRYRIAARQALADARFLGTYNISVLQALVMLLMSLRADYDAATLWSLTAIAKRIGKRLGVHRTAHDEDVSPFELEMRRRLWFNLVMLDGQIAELVGVGVAWDQLIGDTKIPLNVDDKDLHPDMECLPPEKEGATEMIFILIRFEFGLAMRSIGLRFTPVGMQPVIERMAEIDLAIDKLEQDFGRKYLRYCDPLNPLHFMVTLTARCMICKARFLAHHPKLYPDRGASMSQEERDKVFTLALKTIEYESLAHATQSLQGFFWHYKTQVQFTALIFVIAELRKRKSGPIVEKAWDQVEDIYKHHPELIKEKQRHFFSALGSLITEAWAEREADHKRFFATPLQTPSFVSQLRAQRNKTSDDKSVTSQPSTNVVPSTIYPAGPAPFPMPSQDFSTNQNQTSLYNFGGDFSGQLDLSFDPMGYSQLDWSMWDEMLRDYERQTGQGFSYASIN